MQQPPYNQPGQNQYYQPYHTQPQTYYPQWAGPPNTPQPPVPPYQPYPPYQQPPYQDQARTWAAAQKNYTTNAVWGLLLYFFFWVPGLLVNCYYLYDAYQTKQVIGRNPQGIGCLWTTLILFNGIPLLIVLIVAFVEIVLIVHL